MNEARPTFDLTGPMPGRGVTVLEASAGTGKTYTLATIVARLLAEGTCRTEDLLVVTFTRAATGELRDRARRRLVSTYWDLERYMATRELPGERLARFLVETAADELDVQRRWARLSEALADFDRATITTTHGFCHMVLAALGVWGEVGQGASLLEAPDDLVSEVSDDLYARWVLMNGPLPFRPGPARTVAAAAVAHPGLTVLPVPGTGGATDEILRSRLASGARKEMDRRLLDANLLTYDRLISRLADALEREGRGDAAVQRLRERFNTVLVDEFQDTDLDQWRVVDRAFGSGSTRLVLIGDPKQAIYGFRGADVYAYLAAARAAGPDHQLTLGENWRADGALVDALHSLLWPLHLGHSEIGYEKPLTPATLRGEGAVPDAKRTQSAAQLRPLRLRILSDDLPDLVPTKEHLVTKRSAQLCAARDLAADVCQLLSSGVLLPARGRSGSAGVDAEASMRSVSAGDVGVLVRTNRQAVIVQDALRLRRVPVVVAGAQSVLSTLSAEHWLQLLSALEQPASRSAAVAVALNDFGGARAGELADAPDETWEALHERLHEWAALARSKGIATLFSHITAQTQLPGRLLRDQDGERRLTDLAHVSELLHAEARRHQMGLAALRAWLARHIEDQVGEGVDAEQRARRLESDADAVQVLTVHRAKGLEFPIVYCPFAWDGTAVERAGGPIVFHDHEAGGERRLDVGGDGQSPAYKKHYASYQAERRGEELRHLYVALTRARHQVVVWWAPVRDCQHSALGRVLFSRDAHGEVSAEGLRSVPRYDTVRQRLEAVAAGAPGLVGVEDVSWGPVRQGSASSAAGARDGSGGRLAGTGEGANAGLGAAVLGRDFDRSWQRASYSGIVAEAAASGDSPGSVVSSEPDDTVVVDEPDGPRMARLAAAAGDHEQAGSGAAASERGPAGLDSGRWQDVRVPLGSMPAGAEVGTLVHSALEAVDFTVRPLQGAIRDALRKAASLYMGPPVALDEVAEGLEVAVEYPLGGPLGNLALSSLARRDRVDELRFEMPLAGGDRPCGAVTVAALADVLRRYLPVGTVLGDYPNHLDSLGPQALRGYLTGSLDLVLRAPAPDGQMRYFVADYKTNRLAGRDDVLVYGHYRSEALAAQMVHSHYVLQALLYLVALHRYLLWRLPGYEPDVHLGGAAYLFLRGMGCAGKDAPAGLGVFWWCPPAGLVEDVSVLLASPGNTAPEPTR